MKRLFGFVVMFGIIVSLIACKVSTKNDDSKPVITEDSKTEKYSNEYLEIVITKGIERAAYYEASEIDHFNLVVDFEDSSIEDLNVNFDPNDIYSFNIFKDCTVSLKVSGFDSSSTRIAYGSRNVSFTVGNDVSVTVAVDMFTKGSTVTVGVEINEPSCSGQGVSSGIDYGDYTGRDYSIKVKNECSSNVVCFVGDPSAETLISGAIGGGKTTALKKTSIFCLGSFDFVLNVVTEENYNKYKSDYKTMANNVLCRIYAYYNSDAEANYNLIYTISDKLGGQYYILLNNTAQYNCELRIDGLFGEPFCYAGAQTLKTKIYVQSGDYDFYPVFRKFDNTMGSILTYYLKTSKGNPKNILVSFGGDSDGIAINCADYLTSNFTLTASSAFLKIDNQSSTGIKLYQGENAIASITDTVIATINSGKNATFTIKMEEISNVEGQDRQYEVQTTISSWKIGPEAYKVGIPSKTFEAGYRYVLVVEGESYDDLTCHFEIYESDAPDGTSYKAGDLVKYPVSLD